MSEAAAGGPAPGPGGASGIAPARTPGDRTETVSLTLRRSAARRSRDSSLAKARSSAAYLSSAAASALIAGPDGQLDPLTAVRLPRVAFFGDLHVDPHRLLVKLLELG